MSEEELKECWFINSEMKFYTYEDFVNNCEAIKKLYVESLSKNGKLFFKWYLYANIHIRLPLKNRMWDYLNDYLTFEQFVGVKNIKP